MIVQPPTNLRTAVARFIGQHSRGLLWDVIEGLNELINALVVGSSAVPVGNTIFVDPVNGNNTTGLRGRLDRPFATIQAAADVAQDGDTIHLVPAVYDESVILGAALNGITFLGDDPESTRIAPAAGDALTWAPTTAVVLTLQGIGFAGQNFAVNVQQSAGNNAAKLVCRNCRFTSAGTEDLNVRRIARLETYDCQSAIMASVDDVNSAYLENHQGNIRLDVTPTPPPTVSHSLYRLKGCGQWWNNELKAQLFHHGVANVECDESTALASYDAPTLALGAGIQFYGQTLGMDITASGGLVESDLRGAIINTLVVAYSGAVSPLIFDAKGATIPEMQLTSTGAQDLIVDNRGGFTDFSIGTFGVDCYVDRDLGSTGPLVHPGAGVSSFLFGVDISEPPFPASASVGYTASLWAAAPAAFGDIPYVDSVSPAQADIGAANAVDFLLSWNRQTS